ncbi:MAG: aspartate aminotransferase family protein [bacterium]
MTARSLDQAYVMTTYRHKPVCFVSGSGTTLVDENGKPYHDLLSGLAVCGLGHAHPAVTARIAEQAARLTHVSNLFLNEWQPQLAERLTHLSGMERVFFCNSGAEAIECALKLARKRGHARGIAAPVVVTLEGAFHGRTFGALAATPNPAYQTSFAPMLPGFRVVPHGDLQALAAALTPDVCAVLLEPIQGESGVHPLSESYLRGVRALCDAHEILLMVDEIQCGMFRTGKFLASQHAGIVPDVVTLAKALANGLPIGACLARGVAAEVLQPGDHGSTFGGSPLVSSVALTVLELTEPLAGRVTEIGDWFAEALRAIPGVTEVRGKGLMLGVELAQPVAKTALASLLDAGYVINAVGDTTLRLLPPLIIERAICELFVTTLETTLAQLSQAEVTA